VGRMTFETRSCIYYVKTSIVIYLLIIYVVSVTESLISIWIFSCSITETRKLQSNCDNVGILYHGNKEKLKTAITRT